MLGGQRHLLFGSSFHFWTHDHSSCGTEAAAAFDSPASSVQAPHRVSSFSWSKGQEDRLLPYLLSCVNSSKKGLVTGEEPC